MGKARGDRHSRRRRRLAKQALLRKAEKETERDEAKKALLDQGAYADQLTAALKALEARLKDVKLRKETLKAKARGNATAR